MSELLETIEVVTAPNPTVAIIWMHGLGSNGNDFASLVQQLDWRDLPGIRFVFPHARTMPITMYDGYVMTAWYDIVNRTIAGRDDEVGLRASQANIEALIAREKARGIPAERIVLAGFSQGCAITLQTGLRHPETLAGLMCLSGYLPLADKVEAERTPASLATPIFMAHGRVDDVIALPFSEQSRDKLKALGYQVEWHDYMMPHTVSDEEAVHILAWLKKILA